MVHFSGDFEFGISWWSSRKSRGLRRSSDPDLNISWTMMHIDDQDDRSDRLAFGSADERSDGCLHVRRTVGRFVYTSAEPQRLSSNHVRRTVGIGRHTFLRAGSAQKDSDFAPAEVGPADPHPLRPNRILVVIPIRVSDNRPARHRTCKQPSDRSSADHVTRGAGEDRMRSGVRMRIGRGGWGSAGPTSAGAGSESFGLERALRKVDGRSLRFVGRVNNRLTARSPSRPIRKPEGEEQEWLNFSEGRSKFGCKEIVKFGFCDWFWGIRWSAPLRSHSMRDLRIVLVAPLYQNVWRHSNALLSQILVRSDREHLKVNWRGFPGEP
jgi:hypothetical protein